MDTREFNEEHAAKSRAVCERIEREDAGRKSKPGELGRARAEADGWRKIAERRLGHIDECEKALAKRNALIVELEMRVKELEGELRDSDQLTERERQILDMWPRFDDGKRVWFGDDVSEIDARSFVFVESGAMVTNLTSVPACGKFLKCGQQLKRPAPKVLDADGVEIKVGDSVWGETGQRYEVTALCEYDPSIVHAMFVGGADRLGGELISTSKHVNSATLEASKLTHTRPDSWEKLEDDAAREPCDYFGVECDEDKGCSGCPHLHKGRDCTIDMQPDIVRRAKALAGVEVE